MKMGWCLARQPDRRHAAAGDRAKVSVTQVIGSRM
jgi:hypothetical protein